LLPEKHRGGIRSSALQTQFLLLRTCAYLLFACRKPEMAGYFWWPVGQAVTRVGLGGAGVLRTFGKTTAALA